MRRKNKYITRGAAFAGGLTLAADVFQQWHTKTEKAKKLTLDNFDYRGIFKKIVIAAGVGALAGYAYYEYCIYEEEKLPFDADGYLKKVLSKEQIKNNPRFLSAILDQRTKVKEWAVNKFGTKLAAFPQDTGSFAKRTAIATNYDLDIVLVFQKDSYYSLKDMYYDVYEAVQKAFGGKAVIEKRTKAISLTYLHAGDQISFDIVPGRRINKGAKNNNINLYVRPDWAWQRGSTFKTNHRLHKEITLNKPEARQVIKLLKIYRDRNGYSLPSLVIEQYVVSAMSAANFGVYASLTENLLNSMDYIAQRIVHQRLMDIANTNNNLHNRLSSSSRHSLSEQLITDIKRIEHRPSYIRETFEI
jgi:hypothetical protein